MSFLQRRRAPIRHVNDVVFAHYGDCLFRLDDKHEDYFASFLPKESHLGLPLVQVDTAPGREHLRFYWNCMAEQLHSPSVGYLYLIRCRDYYKIGVTRDFRGRRAKYKTECPDAHDVLFAGEVPGYERIEAMAKQFFAPRRHRGEWFRLRPGEARLLQRVVRHYPKIGAYRDEDGEERFDPEIRVEDLHF